MSSAPYVSSGSLTFQNGQFLLDGKPFRIFSGAMHYFRVPPEYWKDRLLKMKACGLNTVETYVAWNLHEEYPTEFNFSGFLDVRKFIQLAHEVGLYVIFRPGPYICAEWDFGGLPSWLLRDPQMKVRSNYPPYQEAADRFFAELLPKIVDLQHLNGGPIIAVQVENEFGSYSNEVQHLLFIKQLLLKYGIKELLLTSENIFGMERAPFYQHALPTANFPNMEDGQKLFDMIRKWSPDFPLMVTEFWTGWFDHWGNEEHKGLSLPLFEECFRGILNAGASFNMYMFHGGTNFGFMSGANWFKGSTYKPDVTSYDYDAPLSEAGDVTPKYNKAREIIIELGLKSQGIDCLPDPPPNTVKASYGEIEVNEWLPLDDVLLLLGAKQELTQLQPMEELTYYKGYGQNFGYTIYQINAPNLSNLEFVSKPEDRAQVLYNGQEVALFNWLSGNKEVKIPTEKDGKGCLQIITENHGRINYTEFGSNLLNEQRKGLNGGVRTNGEENQCKWDVYSLDFNESFVKRLSDATWKKSSNQTSSVPSLFRGVLHLKDQPNDTFLSMKGWGKGVAFINGFNLGRYWEIGPQCTLFVPAPLLKQGNNEIMVFEQHKFYNSCQFQDTPLLS